MWLSTFSTAPGGHALGDDGLTLLVLLAGVGRGDHGTEQADVRRPGVGIEPAREVMHDVISVELVAVVPFHAFAQVEGPGFQIVRSGPLLAQERPRDVIWSRDHQVLAELPCDVGLFRPVESCRIGHLLCAHRDLQRAALLGCRGGRLGNDVLAGDLSGHRICCRGGHAQQGCRAQELTAVDFVLAEFLAELRNVRVYFGLFLASHDYVSLVRVGHIWRGTILIFHPPAEDRRTAPSDGLIPATSPGPLEDRCGREPKLRRAPTGLANRTNDRRQLSKNGGLLSERDQSGPANESRSKVRSYHLLHARSGQAPGKPLNERTMHSASGM